MNPQLFRLIGALFIVTFTVVALTGLVHIIRKSFLHGRSLGCLAVASAALCVMGFEGFCALWLVGTGTIELSPTTNCPAGRVQQYAEFPHGQRVVPLVPESRVQVYDASWRFLRGWNLDTGGKPFIVLTT